MPGPAVGLRLQGLKEAPRPGRIVPRKQSSPNHAPANSNAGSLWPVTQGSDSYASK